MNLATTPVVRYWRQFILAVLLFACSITYCSSPARAEPIPCADQPWEQVEPCEAKRPRPPLAVLLKDGSVIPTHSLCYDIPSLTIMVIETPRIFCDGMEP